jgi:hypothetical protein
MDGFSFHPYPNSATDPLSAGYTWPAAGFVNLDRVKQALWDAFHGTPQPTTLEGLKLHLDEVGWQVDTSGATGYTGAENVAVTNESTQASIYGDLLRQAACDPSIAQVNFFGFYDDGLRTGFQAGVLRADGTPRPAAEAVRQAIADTALGCVGVPTVWAPRTDVDGALARGPWFDGRVVHARAWAPLTLGVPVSADEGAVARLVVQRVQSTGSGVQRVHARRTLVAATTVTSVCPPRGARLRLVLPRGFSPGTYQVAVRFRAEVNSGRRIVLRGQSIDVS